MNSTSPPSSRSSAANAWPASSWRPETTTRLPPRAKARAAARPIPVSAPVIKITGVFMLPLLRPARSLARTVEARVLRHASGPTVGAVGADFGFPGVPEKDFVSLMDMPPGHGGRTAMELRHLRYFVAVA